MCLRLWLMVLLLPPHSPVAGEITASVGGILAVGKRGAWEEEVG